MLVMLHERVLGDKANFATEELEPRYRLNNMLAGEACPMQRLLAAS